MLNAELRLSCDGRKHESFIYCRGVDNLILDLTSADGEILEYLDKVTNIFNERCFVYNKIASAVYKIYLEGYMGEERYKIVCDFYNFHKQCGINLYCRLK